MCKTREAQLRAHYRKYHPDERFPISTPELVVPGVENLVEALLIMQRPADSNWSWAGTSTRVYFILSGAPGRPIKIGVSRSLRDRLTDLQLASPDPLHVLLTYEGDRQEERVLQRRFEKHWIQGEWFRSDPEIVDYIWDKLMTTPVPMERAARDLKFFQPRVPRTKPTFEDHLALARELGVKTGTQWIHLHNSGELPDGFLKRPEKAFPEWSGWKDFLGTVETNRRGRPRRDPAPMV